MSGPSFSDKNDRTPESNSRLQPLNTAAVEHAEALIPKLKVFANDPIAETSDRIERLFLLARSLAYTGKVHESQSITEQVIKLCKSSDVIDDNEIKNMEITLLSFIAAAHEGLGDKVRAQEIFKTVHAKIEKLPAPILDEDPDEAPTNYISALSEADLNFSAMGADEFASLTAQKLRRAYPIQFFGQVNALESSEYDFDSGVGTLIQEKKFDEALNYLENLYVKSSISPGSLSLDYLRLYHRAYCAGEREIMSAAQQGLDRAAKAIEDRSEYASVLATIAQVFLETGEAEQAYNISSEWQRVEKEVERGSWVLMRFGTPLIASAIAAEKEFSTTDWIKLAKILRHKELDEPERLLATVEAGIAVGGAAKMLINSNMPEHALKAADMSAQILSSKDAQAAPFGMKNLLGSDASLIELATDKQLLALNPERTLAYANGLRDSISKYIFRYEAAEALSKLPDDKSRSLANSFLNSIEITKPEINSPEFSREAIKDWPIAKRETFIANLMQEARLACHYVVAAENCGRRELVERGLELIDHHIKTLENVSLSKKSAQVAKLYSVLIDWAGENSYGKLVEKFANHAIDTFNNNWRPARESLPSDILQCNDEDIADSKLDQLVDHTREIIFDSARRSVAQILINDSKIPYCNDIEYRQEMKLFRDRVI